MARWVDAQGQVNSAKNAKTPPLVTSPTENPKRKPKQKCMKSELEDLPNPKRV